VKSFWGGGGGGGDRTPSKTSKIINYMRTCSPRERCWGEHAGRVSKKGFRAVWGGGEKVRKYSRGESESNVKYYGKARKRRSRSAREQGGRTVNSIKKSNHEGWRWGCLSKEKEAECGMTRKPRFSVQARSVWVRKLQSRETRGSPIRKRR